MADEYSINAKITADTTQFKKGVKTAQESIKDFSASMGEMSKMLKSAFSVVGITASIGAVVSFGKKSVQAADDANKKFSVLQNTIEATGASTWTSVEELDNMAKAYAQTTNYSVSEVEKMQSVLLGFRNITDDTFREASDAIMDMATVMGMDLTSAVQTVGKALDDPIKGLDSLRRQGFAFTDEQKLELEVLVKTGKQLEAQKIILEELSTTYGGAAKAGQSAFAQMQHSIDALMESVGNRIIPIIRAVTGEMSGGVEKITEFFNSATFDRIIDVLANIAEKVRTVFSGIVEYISGIFTQLGELSAKVNFSPFIRVLDTLYGLVVAIFEKIKERINESVEKFSLIFSGISSAMGEGEINTVVNAINTVIDAVWFLFEQIDVVVKQIEDAIYDVVIYFITELGDADSAVSKLVDIVYNNLNSAFRTIQDLIYSVSAMLKGDWSVAWEYAKLAVMRSIASMLDGITNLSRGFYGLIDSITFGATDLKSQVADLTKSFGVDTAIVNIEQKIKEMTGKTADIALSDLKGISTASKGMFTDFIAGLTKTTDATKTETNKQKKQFSSSFKETKKETSEIFQGIQKGLLTLKENWEKDAKDWSDVTTSVAGTIGSAFEETFGTLGEELVEGGGSFEDYAAVAVDAISQVLQALAAQLAAIAATKAATYRYAEASIAAAGAAAALVAAGTLKAVANNLKQTSTAAKEATNSIDDFIKRLQKIKETRFTKIGTFSQGIVEYSAEITNAIKNMNEAYAKYDELRNKYTTSELMGISEGTYYKWLNTVNDAQKNYLAWMDKVNEANTGLYKSLTELVQNSKDVVDENSAITSSYRELYNSLTKFSELQKQLSILDDFKYYSIKTGSATGNLAETIRFQYEKYNSYLKTLKNNIKAQVQELENSVYESMLSVGKDIGETFISSIVDGATKTDFMSSIRDYIKKQMIQLVILTDDFSNRISNIGVKLLSAMTTGNSATKFASLYLIKNELGSLYTEMTEKAKGVEEILTAVFGNVNEEVKEFSQSATTIGDTLMQNILNGAKESDFLSSMKTYIKESVLKIAIYSSSLTDKITSIGEELSQAVLSGSKSQINSLKTQLSSLYQTTETQVKGVLSIIDKVFPDEIEKSLTSLEKTIQSFYDNVVDLGEDIASNLINGLTNGLSQSDFLTNMKDWLRKMLVQAVVYTETMKNEIEAIGKAISAGISGGFTDTSLHEIRRDLSYIFEQANKSVGKIDEVLGGVFGYANGTNNATRGLHIVGEAGPELVNFRGGEQVLNNRNTQKALACVDGGNTFNVVFNNTADTTAYAMMSQLRQYNREMAINGVL